PGHACHALHGDRRRQVSQGGHPRRSAADRGGAAPQGQDLQDEGRDQMRWPGRLVGRVPRRPRREVEGYLKGTLSLLSRSSTRMRSACAVLVIASCSCSGCSKKSVHRRTGDAAAVEVVAMPALPDGGSGAASDEIEPNDGDDVATVLLLGATVRGKIDPETDVDHYRIDVTQTGALSVMVSPLEGLDVVLEIEDGSGTVIARSDRGSARVREG